MGVEVGDEQVDTEQVGARAADFTDFVHHRLGAFVPRGELRKVSSSGCSDDETGIRRSAGHRRDPDRFASIQR